MKIFASAVLKLTANDFERFGALISSELQRFDKLVIVNHGYAAMADQILRCLKSVYRGEARSAGAGQNMELSLKLAHLVRHMDQLDSAALRADVPCVLQLPCDLLAKSFEDSISADVTGKFGIGFASNESKVRRPLLPPCDCNGRDDCEHATHRLNPRRPVNRSRWAGLRRMLTQHSPSENYSGDKCHHCHHRPISIGPLLFHEFPLSLDRILPLGVIA